MINDLLQLREKAQKLLETSRLMKDAYQENKDLLPEIREQRRNKYLSEIKAKSKDDYELLKFELGLKSDKIKSEINSKKFPLQNSAFPDAVQLESIKARAENLALHKLDYNILNYLQSAMDKNENDFLFNFSQALKLNSEVPNELKLEINQKYQDYSDKNGISKLNLELQLAEKINEQIQTYEKIATDGSPESKMSLLYSDSGINQLTEQINNLN